MSSSIKDIIKTFKDLNEKEEPAISAQDPSVSEPQKRVGAQKTKPKAEKQEKNTEPKTVVQAAEKPTNTGKIRLDDAFFMALADQEFNYEDRKIAYLESDLYEIFMSVKRKKRVKNVSVLINAILNQFVDEHREDLKVILANTKL
jgi:hypothetical protein